MEAAVGRPAKDGLRRDAACDSPSRVPSSLSWTPKSTGKRACLFTSPGCCLPHALRSWLILIEDAAIRSTLPNHFRSLHSPALFLNPEERSRSGNIFIVHLDRPVLRASWNDSQRAEPTKRRRKCAIWTLLPFFIQLAHAAAAVMSEVPKIITVVILGTSYTVTWYLML